MFCIRFIIEFIKESQGGFEEFLGIFSTGQWLSIPFVLLGLFLMFFCSQESLNEFVKNFLCRHSNVFFKRLHGF